MLEFFIMVGLPVAIAIANYVKSKYEVRKLSEETAKLKSLSYDQLVNKVAVDILATMKKELNERLPEPNKKA